MVPTFKAAAIASISQLVFGSTAASLAEAASTSRFTKISVSAIAFTAASTPVNTSVYTSTPIPTTTITNIFTPMNTSVNVFATITAERGDLDLCKGQDHRPCPDPAPTEATSVWTFTAPVVTTTTTDVITLVSTIIDVSTVTSATTITVVSTATTDATSTSTTFTSVTPITPVPTTSESMSTTTSGATSTTTTITTVTAPVSALTTSDSPTTNTIVATSTSTTVTTVTPVVPAPSPSQLKAIPRYRREWCKPPTGPHLKGNELTCVQDWRPWGAKETPFPLPDPMPKIDHNCQTDTAAALAKWRAWCGAAAGKAYPNCWSRAPRDDRCCEKDDKAKVKKHPNGSCKKFLPKGDYEWYMYAGGV